MKEERGLSRSLRQVEQVDFLPMLFIVIVIYVDREGIGS